MHYFLSFDFGRPLSLGDLWSRLSTGGSLSGFVAILFSETVVIPYGASNDDGPIIGRQNLVREFDFVRVV